MIKTVSVEIPTNQTEKKEPVKISNKDFLNILLSNISKDEEETKEVPKNLTELLQSKDEKSDTKTVSLNELLTLTSDSQESSEDLNLSEIKKIISSKIKQENILLSEAEQKEFKEIKSLKELIKFANKKGLNVENIKVEVSQKNEKIEVVPKKEELRESITSSLIKDKEVKTENRKSETKIDLTSIISNNKNSKTKESIDKTEIKPTEKIEKTVENKISKETTAEVIDKEVKKVDTKSQTTQKTVPTQKEIKAEVETTQKTEPIQTTKEIKKSESIKAISLDDLINPNKTSTKKENKTTKVETEPSNNNISSSTLSNDIKLKTIFAKDTLKQFSSNLQEAIKEYKPPISKLSMELNPENLGKIEVTLVKRGNELQVTLNSSNQTTMQLFAQNQVEFRANLANIGFSNVDMSFNSNKDQNDKNREKYKQNQNSNNEDEEISEIEIKGILKYA